MTNQYAYVVRLCLQVKTFCFIVKGFVTICLSRQALTSIFESAVLCAFITARIPMKWFHSRDETNSLIRLKHTSIHSVEQSESCKPHSKAIGHTSSLQRVFFLVLVNNFLSHTRKPFHKPVKTAHNSCDVGLFSLIPTSIDSL